MNKLDKHEKWLHFGAALIATLIAFASDAMGIELSEQTTWLLYAFAGGASVLGSAKAFLNRSKPVTVTVEPDPKPSETETAE